MLISSKTQSFLFQRLTPIFTCSVGANFLSTVYTYHIKNSQSDADWELMFQYYKIAISPQEQTRALVAISSTNNRDRLNQ